MQISEAKALADGQFCVRVVSRVDLEALLPLEDEANASLEPALGYHLSFVVKAGNFSRAAALVEERLAALTSPADGEIGPGWVSTLEMEALPKETLNEAMHGQMDDQPGQELILFESKRCYFSHDDVGSDS